MYLNLLSLVGTLKRPGKYVPLSKIPHIKMIPYLQRAVYFNITTHYY